MTRQVPLFPLGSVLYPGLVLPLHIFEPRYRLLVQHLQQLPEDDRVFAVVAIRAGHEVGPGAARALHTVGCLARVQNVTELPDGRYDMVSVGTSRVTLVEVQGLDPGEAPTGDRPGAPDAAGASQARPRSGRRRRDREPVAPDGSGFLRAGVTELPEDDGEAPALVARAVGVEFARYREALGVSAVRTEDLDPALLSYVVSSAMLLDRSDRQLLLEAVDTTARLRLALRLLRREAVILRELGAVPGTDAARMVPGLN